MDTKTALKVTIRVSVEGYLDIPHRQVWLCNQYSCPAAPLRAPGGVNKALSISLPLGDEPARMKALPESFTERDLQVHATDGNVVGVGAKVRITGRKLGRVKEGDCQLVNVDRVDAS